MGYVDSAGKSEIAQNGAIELRGGRGKCLSHLKKALRHDLRTGENKGMVGLGGLEPPTSPLSELRSLVPPEEFTHGAFVCRSRHLLQGTILERSRTENPVDSAALANRWSPQMKLLDGRCPHHTKDAASCRPSAARKGC